MRTLACLTLPAVLAGLIFAPPAAGQAKPRVQITDVRLGFPAGPFSRDLDEDGRARPLFKAAFFAPVYVDVQCNEAVEEPLRLVVSTADGTDVMHTYTVPLPPLSPGQTLSAVELPYLPYTKPGSFIAELEVSLHAGERRLGQPFTRTFFGLDPSEYLILTAGSRLPAFRLPPRPGAPEADAADLGAVRLAAVEHARQLPDRWFGYEGVDLMILTTGGDEGRLVQDLFTLPENRSRKAALLEWVRRGGRLLVSVGRSADVVVPLDEFQQILPATIPPGGRRSADVIELRWVGVGDLARKQLRLRPGDGGQVPYAALQPRPDRAARALPQQSEPSPLIVQAPYGLGRVTLAGFDLDQPPFTEAESPGEFWQWLVNRSASRLPERAADGTLPRDNRFRPGAVESDLYLNTLQANLEYFEGVPVVSFGWVALFIVLYILIIGPLDYLFLKKVVKRLEWTWVTFPLVVVVVSAAAYFTAYALKGRDLKVNKIDLVDIDLRTGRTYGTSWFTVFSPRIQNYAVGLEPAAPGWSPAGPDQTAESTVVSWFGQAGGGRQSLFRRSYAYHVNPEKGLFASGLESVPIQVWSTKAFTASWSAPSDPRQPLIESGLRHPRGNADTVIGTLTSNLPVEELFDAHLVYRGKVYPLGTLVRGTPKQVVLGEGVDVTRWLQESAPEPPPAALRYRRGGSPGADLRLWRVLFHEAVQTLGELRNASLRQLDQSWRMDESNRDEVMLLARLPMVEGPAEEITARPLSPTRLWLDDLPGTGAARGPLPGTLRQETYLRAFIPVEAAE